MVMSVCRAASSNRDVRSMCDAADAVADDEDEHDDEAVKKKTRKKNTQFSLWPDNYVLLIEILIDYVQRKIIMLFNVIKHLTWWS